jgi:hypothetical protein
MKTAGKLVSAVRKMWQQGKINKTEARKRIRAIYRKFRDKAMSKSKKAQLKRNIDASNDYWGGKSSLERSWGSGDD